MSLEMIKIHRYLTGEMNTFEQNEFLSWVNEDDRNKKLFSEISTIWNASGNVNPVKFNAKNAYLKHKMQLEQESLATHDHPNHATIIAIEPKKSDQNSNHNSNTINKNIKVFSIRNLAAVAASMLLIVSFWYVINNNQSTTYDSKHSLIAALEDGSNVMMGEGGKVSFKQTSDSRTLELNGKAYFEVKNNKIPFVVIADSMEVHVVGTEFTVDSDEKTVYVKEGIVDVLYKGKTQRLVANQMVNVKSDKLSDANNVNFYDSGLWLNNNLSFNKTPFDIVIQDISKHFGIHFEIPQGRDWTNCTFSSGPLKNNTIDQIITTLKLTYELDCVKVDDKNFKISKVKCR